MLSKLPIAILLLTTAFEITNSKTSTCPDHLQKLIDAVGGCETVDCNVGLSQSSCPSSTIYQEGATFCGCCPACINYQAGLGESCDANAPDGKYDPSCNELHCAILRQCQPGLKCAYLGGGKSSCLPLTISSDCKNECFIKRAQIQFDNKLFQPKERRHLPNCNADGSYAPTQCKGSRNDGICFCSDECGNRIFGTQLYENAANMTCGCSRRVHELRTKQNRLATLHCSPNGDFEPLQCDTDSELCYCVNEETGAVTGEVVPEHKFLHLPCYNASVKEFAGGRYLRICESEWAAGEKISREAALHGLTYANRPLTCDYDGGFAPAFWDTALGQERCVHRSGMPLGYFRKYSSKPRMDCQCARDGVFYPRNGKPFLIECDGTGSDKDTGPGPGSYRVFYTNEKFAYCVDIDGFQFGPDVPAQFGCCLDDTCPNNLKANCTTDNSNYPYKECTEYPLGRN